MASYKSSKFLILLSSSNENGDGDDDDPNVGMFLLMNTRNLCTGVCGSFAYIIRPSISTTNTSITLHLLYDRNIQLVSHPYITIFDKDAFLTFIIEFGPFFI